MIRILAITLCLLLLGINTSQAEPSQFPQTWTEPQSGQVLEKLGDYRYVYGYFFKLYDAALYTEPSADAQAVLNYTASFHLEFRYLREIKKSIILESADKMLNKNLSEAERTSIESSVDQLNARYQTVKKGDRSSLTYVPGEGTTFRLNGDAQLTLPGKEFAQLYFQIWLGDSPISPEMKAALLGYQ